MLRAFVAVELTDPVRDVLAAACAAFRDRAPAWAGEKWVAPRNIHLTLRFLGGVDEALAVPLGDAVADAVRDVPAFTLPLGGVRAVPSPRRATMLWGELEDPDGAAKLLAAAVSDAVAPFCAEAPSKPFASHLTLVRARRPRPAPQDAVEAASAVARGSGAVVSVSCVTLFSSTLTREGPVYTAIRKAPLVSA